MERRELIKSIALLTGVAVVGGEFFLTGCKSAAGPVSAFTPATIALLDEVAETIILPRIHQVQKLLKLEHS